MLDAAGNEVAQVTVYRAAMDHLHGASIMVPEPEPGWHAIAIDGEVALVYGAPDASVP